MRYAIFTDIHANLEALEAVLAKIDELAQEEPVDQIWFLGDLVGYGPNPNECIVKLRERTDVIIAGNHDWAAVGKIDLDDFSEAARISAEWTAEQLTEEHRAFLADLPERLEIGDCTLVHGSPYGPLWEYLTSEALAERSFQYFTSRFCLVGHTHVPIIFQQPESAADIPTVPLENDEQSALACAPHDGMDESEHPDNGTLDSDDDDETVEMVAVRRQAAQTTTRGESAHIDAASSPGAVPADTPQASQQEQDAKEKTAEDSPSPEPAQKKDLSTPAAEREEEGSADRDDAEAAPETPTAEVKAEVHPASSEEVQEPEIQSDFTGETSSEETIISAEDRLNQEIEELLTLLGLSQSMIQVTNEMIVPPEGLWQPAEGHRAIINPGGVGQPRDGDPRAAFMIYDTERGFTFYRIGYDIEKTQEKIIKAGLPQYLATRLAFGR
jgi:diadenosine tetraphosphatase ApaH/serine/threonine PP2A family protein phosphatase